MSFPERMPFVVNGEPIDDITANRTALISDLREQYLRDRINAAELGENLVVVGVALDPAVLVNQPVAWNAITARFEAALASVVTDPSSGALVPAPLSRCLGLVLRKTAAGVGDLILSGRVRTDLSNAVSVPSVGTYYLSTGVAGTMTAAKPAVSVPLLYWDGTYAYVNIRSHDFLESHVHYRFELTCAPAGQNTVVLSRHTVTSPDPGLPGWLPADHASFNGTAPTGAVFGYNLALDAELAAVWPPVPLSSLVFAFDQGLGDVGAQLIPQGLNGLIYADNNGLWWMSDCEGDVPWPTDYDQMAPPTPAPDNSSTPECPRLQDMRLTVGFTEMLFATDKTVVTSLVAASGSAITITDCQGNPASTGPLMADLNLSFLTDADNIDGDRVFKDLVDGTLLKAGYVTEALIPGANIAMSSTRPQVVSGVTRHRGVITIEAQVDLTGRELQPQIIRLGQAVERSASDIPYIGLPAGRISGARLRFDIPSVGLPATPTLRLRLWLLGTVTGTLPIMGVTYRVLPRPATGLAEAVPASDAIVTCTTNLAITIGQYREVESAPITVTPGCSVFFSLVRNSGDGYGGEVGFIRASGVVSSS